MRHGQRTSLILFVINLFLLILVIIHSCDLCTRPRENPSEPEETVEETETPDRIPFEIRDWVNYYNNVYLMHSNQVVEAETEVEVEVEDTADSATPQYSTVSSYTKPELLIRTPLYVQLSDAEIRDMAALVYLESGSCSFECQQAIASVILNRMTVRGQSLYEVMYAKGQFTPASKVLYTEPSELSIQAVEDVLLNGPTIDTYVEFFRASYYFSWAQPYMTIDNVYFSYNQAVYDAITSSEIVYEDELQMNDEPELIEDSLNIVTTDTGSYEECYSELADLMELRMEYELTEEN